jgi:hypothetical protein
VSVPDDLVAAAFGTLSLPIQAEGITGTTIDLTLTYDPAVFQATGATLTPITHDAVITVDLSSPGEVRITLDRPEPFAGSGPIAMVQFQVVGAAGTACAQNLTRADVNGGAVSSCREAGHAAVCAEVPAEIQGVTVSGKTVTTITWTADTTSVSYDVAGGLLSLLRADHSAIAAACLAHGSSTPTADDAHANPQLGDGYYYIVRAQTACGKGTYGSGSYGETRSPVQTCP